MRAIGVVDWTSRDKKNGIPIAGVVPLVENKKGEWRAIDAQDEFPSQGQVFWFAAHAAVEKALFKFHVKPNPGQKDEYQVEGPEPLWEVLDLSRFGSPAEVRTTLISGVARVPGPVGQVRGFILCKSDVLVGPVDLTRGYDNTVKLNGSAHPRVPVYTGAILRSLSISEDEQRLIRVDEGAPSGYVDWDDDATLLKRAIEVAAKVARQAGRDTGQTKKLIEGAASALASSGLGPEGQLSRYRLERALALIENSDVVTRAADEIIDLLLKHAVVDHALSAHKKGVAVEVERSIREELKLKLAEGLKELEEVTERLVRGRAELEAIERSLHEIEAAVDSRVRAALERPADLLGEVSVLRPLLGLGDPVKAERQLPGPSGKLDWSYSGESINDAVALRRLLTTAARSRGVDPALMLQLHAATVAGLMPVTIGPGALAALTAYADGTCGGRLLIIHVSPAAIHPNDFDALPGGGLLAAAESARDIDGLSLCVLEGANRSPLEASVVPLLQLAEVGLSSHHSGGLRLAASLVLGATTVPVTPQLWSHAVAIWPEPTLPSGQSTGLGTVALSSDLFALGDEPTGVIDQLMDAWPDSRGLRPTMTRFGSALARLYSDERRITDALLNGIILPYVATALTAEEQEHAVSQARDADDSVTLGLRRLRRSLS